MNIFNKITKRIHKFLYYKNIFGLRYAFWNHLCSVFEERIRLFKPIIIKNRHRTIMNYLSTVYAEIINDFQIRPFDNNPLIKPDSTIWVCWWDGLDTMPEIVQACYNSIQKYSGAYHVQLITKNNFQNFVSIPDYIIEKLHSNSMSITHFSDILRVSLLYEHGGIWLDATILVTDKISIDGLSFFTLKETFKTDNISNARWAGFCLAGARGNIFFDYMKTFFYSYWKTQNTLIDYVLIDYAIAIAYDYIPQIKLLFDSVPYNNPNIYSLITNINNEYSKELFDEICTDTMFHKLTRKKKLYTHSLENRLTFYGYIINDYTAVRYK